MVCLRRVYSNLSTKIDRERLPIPAVGSGTYLPGRDMEKYFLNPNSKREVRQNFKKMSREKYHSVATLSEKYKITQTKRERTLLTVPCPS